MTETSLPVRTRCVVTLSRFSIDYGCFVERPYWLRLHGCVLPPRHKANVSFSATTGLEGTAEARVPLNEDPIEDIAAKAGSVVNDVAAKAGEKVGEVKKTASDATGTSTEGLSLMVKLFGAAIIVGACVAFIRAFAPRRAGHAGRHGAYEKMGA